MGSNEERHSGHRGQFKQTSKSFTWTSVTVKWEKFGALLKLVSLAQVAFCTKIRKNFHFIGIFRKVAGHSIADSYTHTRNIRLHNVRRSGYFVYTLTQVNRDCLTLEYCEQGSTNLLKINRILIIYTYKTCSPIITLVPEDQNVMVMHMDCPRWQFK